MLEMKNVTKTFLKGTPDEQTALDNFCLHVEDGEFVTVIGSNGAGKSTMFNAIGGSFFPDRGKIQLGGKDITFLPEHRRALMIGRLFQDPMRGSAPDMTIEENLALAFSRKNGRHALGIGIKRSDRDFFRSELRALDMGLEDRMGTRVGLLSGGQRQALSLIMSTVGAPELLLLDEHTAALDPAAAEKIMRITNDIIARRGLTAMMVTHNVGTALKTGTRTIMLDRGKLILDLSGEERGKMTVARLMELYAHGGKALDTDRMLFTQ